MSEPWCCSCGVFWSCSPARVHPLGKIGLHLPWSNISWAMSMYCSVPLTWQTLTQISHFLLVGTMHELHCTDSLIFITSMQLISLFIIWFKAPESPIHMFFMKNSNISQLIVYSIPASIGILIAGIPNRPNPNMGQWPDNSMKKMMHRHCLVENQHSLEWPHHTKALVAHFL